MAKTISALPAAAQATDADELEVNQDGTSRKVTRAQLVSGLAIDSHGHVLADVTDAGALAGRNSVGSPEIDTGAVSTAKIADGAVTPAKLDRGYAELGHTHAAATSGSDGYMSGTDKAKLDGIQAGAEANRALASQAEAEAGTDNAKGMTPLRTAQAISALAASHSHTLADITDAGTLARLDLAATDDIADGAVTPAKLDRGYAELGHTHAAATSGSDGYMSGTDKAKLDGIQAGAEANRALASQAEAEAGTDNAKGMTPLRTAQAISALAATHNHTLADISDAGALAGLDVAATDDIADSAITPAKLAHVEDLVAGAHTLAATDRSRMKVYTGGGDTWTIPNIGIGRVDVINDGTGDITLSPSGVDLLGAATIPAGRAATLIGYAGGAKVKNVVEGSWI